VEKKKLWRFLTIFGKIISQFVNETVTGAAWAARFSFGLTAILNLANIRDEYRKRQSNPVV
jgi:hypothetical protein